MKFIGQYIQDFIARFRSDVYLEDVSTGTIASGANLGLDSHNKIVKNTVGGSSTTDLTSDVTGVLPIANGGTNSNSAENARTALGVDAAGTDNSTNVTLTGTPDYITISGQEITRNQIDLANDVTGTLAAGNVATLNQDTSGNAATATKLAATKTIAGVAFDGSANISLNNSAITNGAGYTANTGDITSVQFTSSVGSHAESSGAAEFILAGSNGLTFTNVDETFTVSASNASTSAKGVASFSSDNFAASSGAISIKSGGVDLTDEVTGTLPVGNGGTGATTLTSNSILTGNGTSAVQAESTLSYSGEVLDIGADDDGEATIRRLRHTDEAGGQLLLRGGDATGTDKDGGNLQLFGGRATGSGAGGGVIIQAGEDNAGSGTTLRGTNVIASFRSDGDTLLQGNLIFEGSVPDTHETTFSITNPTADRTITVPNEDVDLGEVNHHFDYLHINLLMSAASSNQYMSYGGHYNFNIGATAYTDGGSVVNKNSTKWSHYQAITACSVHTVMYSFTDTGGGSGDDYVFELWEIVQLIY